MNCSTPGLPVHHQLLEFIQIHVHRVSDAIQPSHPLLSPSSPAPNPSQHQGLFQWVNSLHEVAKVLEFQLQHQSFQWTPRTHLLQDGLVGSPCSPRDSQESSPTPQFKSINFSALSFLHSQLISNPQNMLFGPWDMFFAQRPPNNKTIVADKAYNLPSGVFRLMTLKTCSVHTKKSFMERRLLKMKDPYCTEIWKFQSAITVLAGPCKDKKTPLPYLGEELMREPWPLLKKDKEDLLPRPSLPVRMKMQPSGYSGQWEPAHMGNLQPYTWTNSNKLCVPSRCSCVQLCSPMDYSPPGSSVHGIFQARILEWVAISFFRVSSPPRGWTHVSCIAGRFFTAEPSPSQGTLQKTLC